MKVLFLGAGKQGKTAIEDLVSNGIEEIIVGDYKKENAQEIAKTHENEETKIIPKKLDVTNREKLLDLMKEADAVANTVGPFYRYGVGVLEVAIEVGVDFIDICDDPVPMVEELDLDGEARDAGVTAVVGLGNNPGSGNLCAKLGAENLDEVDEVNIYWVHPSDSGTSGAGIKHAIEIFSGKVTTYEDNEFVKVPASSGREMVTLPDPVGEVEVYHSGHPEPITLPRYIDGVEKVTCKGGITPVWANRVFRDFIDYGLASTEPIDVGGTSVVPREFTESFLKSFTENVEEEQGILASRVVVKGSKNGTQVCYKYDKIGREWKAGVSIAIGLQMLIQGKIEEKGVFPPEACIDPKEFFKEMNKRGLELREERITDKIKF